MSITKDQASDLKVLQERVVMAAVNLEHAKLANNKALENYHNFVYNLQQEK